MEGAEPSDETLLELPIDGGEKRRRAPEPTRSPNSKARPILLALAVIVLGLVGANLLLGSDADEAEEAASDGSETASGDDLADTDTPADPSPAPRVLTARPDPEFTDLTDGQVVRYELDALPFSASTVTVVCLSEPDLAVASIFDECDSGTAQRHTTSPGGVVEANVTVHRQIAVGGFRRLDCAERACELRTFAAEATGVVVGRASLAWTDAPAQRFGPQIAIETEGPLTQGTVFTITGSGFPAETAVRIRPCRVGVGFDPFTCEQVLADTEVVTGTDGTFRFTDVVDWQVALGTETGTCADLARGATVGLCAVTVVLPGAERQPAAVPLDIVVDLRAGAIPELPETLEVSPVADLADGDTITISIDQPFAETEFEPFLCAQGGDPLDCTWLDIGGRIDDGSYEIPRAFVTVQANRHDCLIDGPCEISVFSFRDPEQRLTFPIVFDAEAELRPPVPVLVEPTIGLQDASVLSVGFEELVSVPLLSVCATGTTHTCAGLMTDALNGRQLITRVSTVLDTPEGPHNCVIDGPCELVVWDAATLTRFETTPLEFAPTDQRPLTGVVRPADGIRHGQTVQVAFVDAIAQEVSVSICVVDGDCVPLIVAAGEPGRGLVELTAVQRFEIPTDDGIVRSVDCAVDQCEIRVSDGWATDQIPLMFIDDPPPPAALAITVDEPLPLDEPLAVRGRDFTPTVNPSEIRFLLCPPWAELDSSCVRVGTVSTRRLAADGTFETEITIPSSAFTTGFQNAMDRCDRECVLVARPLLGEAVRLDVLRDTNPP